MSAVQAEGQAQAPKPARQPVLFLGHGAITHTLSPGSDALRFLFETGKSFAAQRPDKLLVISAHAESDPVRATSAAEPPMVHDHPSVEHHAVKYPAKGDPALALRALALLELAGLRTQADPHVGFDHGAWMVALPLFPKADVPMVQLSLHASLDPRTHLELGRALSPLRDEGVAIVCSGNVVHNQAEFRRALQAGEPPGAPPPAWAREFESWTTALVEDEPEARDRGLVAFNLHPQALRAHPRSEHFLPLLVAAGAARSDRGVCVHRSWQPGVAMTAYAFEAQEPAPA